MAGAGRIGWTALLVALWGGAAEANANLRDAGYQCARMAGNTQVALELATRIVVRNDLPANRMPGKYNRHTLVPHPLGATSIETETTVQVETGRNVVFMRGPWATERRFVPMPDISCVTVSKVEGRVDVVIAIHVPSQFPPDSCNHRVLLEHERAHAAAIEQAATAFRGRLQAALEEAAQRYTPALSNLGVDDAERPRNHFREVVEANLRRFEEEQVTAAAQIDTAPVLAELVTSCPSWNNR